jgi:chromosome segregation ATPase
MAIRKAQIQITTQVDSSAAQKAASDIEALSTASQNAAKEIDSISQSADAAMAALQKLSIPEIEVQEISPEVDLSSIKTAIEELTKLDDRIKMAGQLEARPNVDTSKIQSAIAEIQKLDAKIKSSDDTKPRIQIDASQIRSAVAEIAKLQTSVQKSDQKTIRPKTDASQVKAATRETEKLNTSLKSVDAQKIRPEVDATSINRASASLEGLNTSATQASSGTKDVGINAARAGQEISQFATQVASGGSALQSFAQNAPQFLAAFGPKGQIAAALVSVGALAAQIFLGMGRDAQDASKEADEFAEILKKIGEEAAKVIKEDIDFGRQRFRAAQQQANAFEEGIRDIEDADREYTTSALSNAEKIRKSIITLLELQGKQVDARKSEEQADAAAAEQRRVAAENLIAKEQQRAAIAQDAKEDAEEALAYAQQQIIATQQALEKDDQRLQTLRQQREEQEKLLEQTKRISPVAITPAGGISPAGLTQKQVFGVTYGPGVEGPSEELLAEITQIEGRIKGQQEALQAQTGKLAQDLNEAYDNLAVASTDFNSAMETAKGNVQRITEAFEASEFEITTERLKETAQKQSDAIKEVISTIQPQTESQLQSIEALKQATADGKITADENLKVASNLQLLLSTSKVGQESMNASLRELISNQSVLTSKLQSANNEIGQLRSKINNLFIPVR